MATVAEVRIAAEAFLPDPVTRKRCLEIFATTILQVHSVNPHSWAVTFNPGKDKAIRLNVGMIYVCNLYQGGITLTLYAPLQNPKPLQPFLSSSNFQVLNRLLNGSTQPEPNAPRFTSLPEAVWCWFLAQD
ncbi:MAG: hypothetical protein Fur005_49010 [Roseiflexaceae bacterium]